MDLNFNIKQIAEKLEVCEQTIVNLEMKRNQPSNQILKSIVPFIRENLNGKLSKQKFWDLIFKNNPSYPIIQDTLGKKLRATRMQNFLSIKNLAKELSVDPTSVARWELSKSKPLPEYQSKILNWIKQNG